MGIPSLFRWLSNKYPKIQSQVIEELLPTLTSNCPSKINSSSPNPNGVEIDNLYLDMNGIIHPCCHPEDKPAPLTEEAMFIEIFAYIDRIFAIIRPRKILYMAIDGVAPRAKMNQQRSRRFRAAQEDELKRADEETARLEWSGGKLNENESIKSLHFDSNCITPGTPFMDNLATCLRYYITDRLNNNSGWSAIQVILSDASVPGEGEHKIMDFIRRQKTLINYNPSTKHVLYGLDADLIMLALATHEPNFYILREDVTFKNSKQRACAICGQNGHSAFQCTGAEKSIVGQFDDQSIYLDLKPFIFVHISILREYLDTEMKVLDIPFEWNLERAIDDWVFMCFFVGNDFLPHLPSLEIREGAVELLIGIWKSQARRWNGYLTNSGDISLERVQSVLEELGVIEDTTFQNRREEDERQRVSRYDRKQRNKHGKGYQPRDRGPSALKRNDALIQEQMSELETYSVKDKKPIAKRKIDAVLERDKDLPRFAHKVPLAGDNLSAAKKLKLQLLGSKVLKDVSVSGFSITDFQKSDPIVDPEVYVQTTGILENRQEKEIKNVEKSNPDFSLNSDRQETKEMIELATHINPSVNKDTEIDSDEEAPLDNVRLWESGWKKRYYEKKFLVSEGDDKFRQMVVQSYVEGLCWVLKYYYQGVQSWKWYYPFNYSPFASDFRQIQTLSIKFEKSQPFKPIEQLMGVFPAASKAHIPQPFHHLMTDSRSPILDFYPLEFPIDLNGKKFAWQGVALLPFIDAGRLLKEIEPLYHRLTADERRRNSLGHDILFESQNHPTFESLCSVYSNSVIADIDLGNSRQGQLGGYISKYENVCLPGGIHHSPLIEYKLSNIDNKSSIGVVYRMPSLPPDFIFPAILLKKAEIPGKILNDEDRHAIRMGYTSRGRGGGFTRGGGRGRGGAQRMIQHGLAIPRSLNRDTGRFNTKIDEFGRQIRDDVADISNSRNQQGGGFSSHGNYQGNRFSDSGSRDSNYRAYDTRNQDNSGRDRGSGSRNDLTTRNNYQANYRNNDLNYNSINSISRSGNRDLSPSYSGYEDRNMSSKHTHQSAGHVKSQYSARNDSRGYQQEHAPARQSYTQKQSSTNIRSAPNYAKSSQHNLAESESEQRYQHRHVGNSGQPDIMPASSSTAIVADLLSQLSKQHSSRK